MIPVRRAFLVLGCALATLLSVGQGSTLAVRRSIESGGNRLSAVRHLNSGRAPVSRPRVPYRRVCDEAVTSQSDRQKAVLYRKGCDRGSAMACALLGYAYETGAGVRSDRERAAALYRKSCDRDYAAGCGLLGVLYADGRGVPKDLRKAATFFQKSCDGGVSRACERLGKAFAAGLGVEKDAGRARGLLELACKGGDRDACAGSRPERAEVHDHTPRHGGVVGMAGSFHLEAVAESDGAVRLYVSDLARTPIPASSVRGTVTMSGADGAGSAVERRRVSLVAKGPALAAQGTWPRESTEVDARFDLRILGEPLGIDFTLRVVPPDRRGLERAVVSAR